MESQKVDMRIYMADLLLLLYFILLFCERAAAVICGFVADGYVFTASADWLQWYVHLATLASLIGFVIVGCVPVAKLVRGVFDMSKSAHPAEYCRASVAAGILLVGGMIHTNLTILPLQFAAYGCLLVSMLLVALYASRRPRYDTPPVRTALSFIYILCFSMAIPVVYGRAFAPLEIAVSLVLVALFTYMLKAYYASGGRVTLGCVIPIITVACDAVIIALGWKTWINMFLLVFAGLTLLAWIVARAVCGARPVYDFRGGKHKRSYFEGWYVKFMNEHEAVAFILSWHADIKGEKYAMLQLASPDGPYSVCLSADKFTARKDRLEVDMGVCRLDEYGFTADVQTDDVNIAARVDFGQFSPIRGDIMGPFSGVPFMQCRHGIVSMKHDISGYVEVNGKRYDFDAGVGYIEKDSGHSFPSGYVWTQGSDKSASVIMAVARIPYLFMNFRGVICDVMTDKREYRLATYDFARVVKCTDRIVVVRKGRLTLEAELIDGNANALAAPTAGDMDRVVHESVSATVRYRLTDGDTQVFEFTTATAGFEADGRP